MMLGQFSVSEEWSSMLESNNAFFEDVESRQSKEELRIGEPVREGFAGQQETLRQLNID